MRTLNKRETTPIDLDWTFDQMLEKASDPEMQIQLNYAYDVVSDIGGRFNDLRAHYDRAYKDICAFNAEIASRASSQDDPIDYLETVKNFDDLLQLILLKEGDLDGMTRIFNKVAYERHLDEMIVKANSISSENTPSNRREKDHDKEEDQPIKKIVANFVLDLDGFKRTNDEISHGAGDEVLMAVVEALKEELRDDDDYIIGRWGGDEFTFAVLVDDEKQAQAIYDRVYSRFNRMKALSHAVATETIVFGDRSASEAISDHVNENYEYEHIAYPIPKGKTKEELLEKKWKFNEDDEIIIPIRASLGMAIADLDKNAKHAFNAADIALDAVKQQHHAADPSLKRGPRI